MRTYEWNGSTWSPFGEIFVLNQTNPVSFGISIGLNNNGDRVVVGDNAGDFAKVFELQNGVGNNLEIL